MRTMKSLLLFTIAAMLTTSCHQDKNAYRMRPTYNNGGYSLAILTTKKANKNIFVSGSVIDVQTREPINFGRVWDGCSDLSVDSTGSYELSFAAYDNLRLIARATGYREVETEPIVIKSGDSLRIDFYLIQNDQPLIDCMPSVSKK